MALQLHLHPLSSFCHKALIAFYENDTAFSPHIVNLGDDEGDAAFRKISPMRKMPGLVDTARGNTLFEATVVIEYLDAFYPGATRFVPQDADAAWRARMWDRFFDLYIHMPMQQIIGEHLKPEAERDAKRVDNLRQQIEQGYDAAEAHMKDREWAAEEGFGLADCAAAPALFYANVPVPMSDRHPALKAYLERLMARPSYLRALAEAKPFFKYYPLLGDLKLRYPDLARTAEA